MGFLSSLFGRNKANSAPESVDPVSYKDYLIYPESRPESGQYRVAGRICSANDENDDRQEHTFIRSDVLMTKDDANELMVRKAKMFIDQMGDKIFS